jgi:chromosome segregation ATPase
MPAKARRGGTEKQQLRSEIETKRGEIRRLQDKFAADSERLKYFQSNQEKFVKYIQDLISSNAQLEKQLEDNTAAHSKAMQHIEHTQDSTQRANRQRLHEALIRRSNSAESVRDVSAQLMQFEQEIRDKTQSYRALLRGRKLQEEEAAMSLDALEEREAKQFGRLLRDHAPQLAFVGTIDSSSEEDDLDELSAMEPFAASAIASNHAQLKAEEERLNKRIETFRQINEKLNLQIKSLAAEEKQTNE